jgi:hypothetical protein
MGSRANFKTSPAPEAYHYNPYSKENCYTDVAATYPGQAPSFAEAAPVKEQPQVSVLHTQLTGLVSFLPYPTESYPVHETDMPKEEMCRVFLGQLPYRVTPMQLSWLLDMIAPGSGLYHMETIVKKVGVRGKRLPTGCVHASAHPDQVDYMIECLSWRVLFDDSGIWFAQDANEQYHLSNYCTAMKHNEHMRFRDRPYQPVVMQRATSKFSSEAFRPRQISGNNTPTHQSFAGSMSSVASCPPTPPHFVTPPASPSYNYGGYHRYYEQAACSPQQQHHYEYDASQVW